MKTIVLLVCGLLAIALPVKSVPCFDFGEGSSVLLPIVNNWIVIMNRSDGSLDFFRTWSEYRNGFGDVGRGEFWLGNEKVQRLTNRAGVNYTLRVEVQVDATGQWFYAEYASFSLDSEANKYTLHVSGFSGNAGDSLANTSVAGGIHNVKGFSTKDVDNDFSAFLNCAQSSQAGWWFNNCLMSCLTCPYRDRFVWDGKGGRPSSGLLRSARMMIKSI